MSDHTGSVRSAVLVVVLSLAAIPAGCRRNPEESAVSQPAPPPATVLAGRATLDVSLQELEKELSAALGSGLDDSGERRILRAEAITDRLLESQLPFTWLSAGPYSLEAKLRQIQALADRVVAEMRSGMDQAALRHDVTGLRTQVIELRRALALGGGRTPPSLDSLLAQHPADSTIITGEPGE